MDHNYQLVADIGGTNARFAIRREGSTDLKNIETLLCENFESPTEAIRQYLSDKHLTVRTACLAVAGLVDEASDTVALTNNTWKFSRRQLINQLDLERLVVINDFVAAAMATTVAEGDDLFPLSNNTEFDLGQQRCILGPGTGLGVAGILTCEGKTCIVSSEGGNRSFSPESELEDHILNLLRARQAPVSSERLLSGGGLVAIYEGVCGYFETPARLSTPGSISNAAFQKDEMAHKALHTFFELLGSFAGDCALTFDATGGVYIGGGIVPRFPEALLQSRFTERFENKLHYETYLKKIPIAIMMHPCPGLLGAAAYLDGI